MPERAPLELPGEFMAALAKRLPTTPDRLSAERATEELMVWLEAAASAGLPLPASFLQVAARLVYEHARLALSPCQNDVFDLAKRLKWENRGRSQADAWQPGDWRKLARLVLKKRRLPTAAFFRQQPRQQPPTPEEVLQNVEIPFSARYVEEALSPAARQLSSPPFDVLLERAKQLVMAVVDDIAEVRAMLGELRNTAAGLPHRPPCRNDSANPSHEFCKCRSNSAK